MATAAGQATSAPNKSRPVANGAYYTASALYNAGFRGWPLTVMTAIAGRESTWNPTALNNNANTNDYSVGLFQINYFGSLLDSRTKQYGSPAQLQSDPQAQANAAYNLAGGNSLSGLGNWNLSASPGNGATPTPLSSPQTYTIVPYLPQAAAAAAQVGTFGPAPTSTVSAVQSWPTSGRPSVVAGGYANGPATSATLTSAQTGGGCGAKGNVFNFGGVAGVGGFSFTYCNLKAVVGGFTLVAGAAVMVIGVAILVGKAAPSAVLSGAQSKLTRKSQPSTSSSESGEGLTPIAPQRSTARERDNERARAEGRRNAEIAGPFPQAA